MIKAARATGPVEVLDGLHHLCRIESELTGEPIERVVAHPGKHRRHEAANRLGVDHAPSDLPRLERHQPPPDRIALGPEIFALVIETLGKAVDHHPERDCVDARADPAVIKRGTRVNCHHVRLSGIADHVGALPSEIGNDGAHVEPCAADQEVIGRMLAIVVHAPGFAQPLAVRFKTAAGKHAGLGRDPLFTRAAVARLVTHDGSGEPVAVEFDAHRLGVVVDLRTERFGTPEIGVDECLAAAHEKRVGARGMKRARKRRLKPHTMTPHPGPAG